MIQKAASKTTPLVEKEGKTVTDYEYLFSMNLQAKLKEKIQGAIYVKVNENDSLVLLRSRDVMAITLICHLPTLQIECLMD